MVYWICQKVSAKTTRTILLVRMVLKKNCTQCKVEYIKVLSLTWIRSLILGKAKWSLRKMAHSEKAELSNTSGRGDMMWWCGVVTWCGGEQPLWRRPLLSESNHEPVIKSKRESQRNSHRDFIRPSVKVNPAWLLVSKETAGITPLLICF